jgi:two-component system, NarL family, invasion response regulator UvrY
MAASPIRVLLVDDHQVVRRGLRMMLAAYKDISVAAEATDSNEALQILRDTKVDVVLSDIALPGRSGLDLLKLIKAQWPQLPVLILTMYMEDMFAVRALKLGAAGYLTKDASESVLAEAIRTAASGKHFVTPNVVEKLTNAIGAEDRRAPHEKLSEREFEVFRMLAAGKSLVHIAEALNVSAKTITSYRARILEKTGFDTNADLTRYALELGLLK